MPSRNSPISGVLLTNADLDHTGGLLLLRENPVLTIHATAAVRESLEASGLTGIVGAFCRIAWHEPPLQFAPLLADDGRDSGLSYRAIFLPGGPPRFDRSAFTRNEGHSIAYQIVDTRTHARLLVAPDVAALTPELRVALADADIVLFDGTFWSSDELSQFRHDAPSAEEMGHLPVSSGSLDALRALPARHKVYMHINNTNPILMTGSPERAEVERAGVTVGYDGWEIEQ